MENLQAQMQSILNDPNMMQTIMAMAQGMSQQQPDKKEPEKAPPPLMDGLDLGMLQKLAGYASQSNIDGNQRNLLSALTPYLSRERISKLERAMRAAKLARMASDIFGSQLLG